MELTSCIQTPVPSSWWAWRNYLSSAPTSSSGRPGPLTGVWSQRNWRLFCGSATLRSTCWKVDHRDSADWNQMFLCKKKKICLYVCIPSPLPTSPVPVHPNTSLPPPIELLWAIHKTSLWWYSWRSLGTEGCGSWWLGGLGGGDQFIFLFAYFWTTACL